MIECYDIKSNVRLPATFTGRNWTTMRLDVSSASKRTKIDRYFIRSRTKMTQNHHSWENHQQSHYSKWQNATLRSDRKFTKPLNLSITHVCKEVRDEKTYSTALACGSVRNDSKLYAVASCSGKLKMHVLKRLRWPFMRNDGSEAALNNWWSIKERLFCNFVKLLYCKYCVYW